MIEELLKNIERSSDFRAKEIASVMQGEYLYYVKNDKANSIRTLRECLDKNKSKHYPKKALNDIYKRADLIMIANELNSKYNNDDETFDY